VTECVFPLQLCFTAPLKNPKRYIREREKHGKSPEGEKYDDRQKKKKTVIIIIIILLERGRVVTM